MLGIGKAKAKVEEAAQTVSSAMVIAVTGLIVALVAIFMAVASYAH